MKAEVGELIRKQPFSAFEVHVSDGRVYSVDHPEFIAISRDGKSITYYTDDGRMVILNTVQITAAEIINRPAA